MKFLENILVIFFQVLKHFKEVIHCAGAIAFIRRANWKAKLGNLGDRTSIFSNVVMHQPEMVSIGSDCVIAEFVHVWGGGGIVIGNNVLIASHAVITSLTHNSNAKMFAETTVKKTVVIENNVWIGASAVILPGVRLGTGCVVGAGAVVTKDVAANSIVVGVPAKVLRKKLEF